MTAWCNVTGAPPAGPVAGFVVDAWTETIPAVKATSGIAVHFDKPSAVAPNAVLLAVTRGDESFDLDVVRRCVRNTLAMAEFRALEPRPGHAFLGQFLPAAFLPDDVVVLAEEGEDVVTWFRLEGSTRDPELTEGLTARVADPLWTLARQWQVGEFHGEDAASPILVTAEVAFTPLTASLPATVRRRRPLDRADADRPLEVLVEQEPVDDDVRLTLELGWILVRALAQISVSRQALAALREPLPRRSSRPPTGSTRSAAPQLELLARRSIDGLRAAAELTDAAAVDAMLVAIGVAAALAARAAAR